MDVDSVRDLVRRGCCEVPGRKRSGKGGGGVSVPPTEGRAGKDRPPSTRLSGQDSKTVF